MSKIKLTMASWPRGILQHEHGAPPEERKWSTAGRGSPGPEENTRHDLPKSIAIRPIGPDQTLSSMLERGEIDAMISAHMPSPFVRRAPKVGRLIPDFPNVEKDYYRRTKIFPIMHTVALREDFYQKHPWVAQSLVKAVAESKRLCQESMYEFSALKYMLAWS